MTPARPRVALVYPSYGKHAGVERIIAELAAAFTGDHDVTIVTSDVQGPIPEGAAVKLVSIIKPAFLGTLWFSLRVLWTLLVGGFDIVHVFGANALRQDVVAAQSCHKAWFKMSVAWTPRFSRRWWLKVLNPVHYVTILIETWQYRAGGARRIIACSQVTKRELVECYGVVPGRVEVVYNGVNLDEFSPSMVSRRRLGARQAYGLHHDDFVMLFAANEFTRKGLAYILAAMQRLQKPIPKLLVVGKDHPESWRQEAASLGLGNQVIFGGPTNDIGAAFAASDVFVFPTTYEAFGLVITEAMACGLPVVTSRLAGAAELIKDGETGLLLDDPRDATAIAERIERLRDAAARRRLGDAAALAVKPYDWTYFATKTRKIYQDILAERGKA